MRLSPSAPRFMRVPRASLRVRRRREQYWDTGPEGAVLAAAGVGLPEPALRNVPALPAHPETLSGGGGAGLRPAGAAAGEGRA